MISAGFSEWLKAYLRWRVDAQKVVSSDLQAVYYDNIASQCCCRTAKSVGALMILLFDKSIHKMNVIVLLYMQDDKSFIGPELDLFIFRSPLSC